MVLAQVQGGDFDFEHFHPNRAAGSSRFISEVSANRLSVVKAFQGLYKDTKIMTPNVHEYIGTSRWLN